MVADANDRGPTAGPAWLQSWLDADARADQAIRAELMAIEASGEPFEGAAFAELEGALQPFSILWAGSSMPVRDLDTFLPAGDTMVRCLANRGANGIDGVLSSSLGAAAMEPPVPVLLILGDISFLHDLNSLAAARIPAVRLTILLVDNDGGGIFSFLPQATADRAEVGLPGRFEQLLGTPHGTDLPAVARALGAEVSQLRPGHIGAAVAASFERPGIKLLHLRTDRTRNVALHRRVLDAVIGAIG
jgi:2-succinyl-5-enolpyruvyl-6-hydroxy-3-cyclohexene-1-carboxylate synthase